MKHLIIALLTTWQGLSGILSAATGVPEPGVIVYGKVLASDGVTTLPPTSLTVTTRFSRQSTPFDVVSVPTEVGPGAGDQTYFVARINFGNEAAVPGSDNQTAGSEIHFDYPASPTDYQLSTLQSGVVSDAQGSNVSVPSPYSPVFQFPGSGGGADERGQLIRMDLLTTIAAPGTSYESFIAGYYAPGSEDSLRTADPDGDKMTNEAEWLFKTDPTNTDSNAELHRVLVEVLPVNGQPDQKEVTFRPKWGDRFYRIILSPDLGQTASFKPDANVGAIIDGAPIGSGAVEASATDSDAVENKMFYKVEASIDGNFPPSP